MKRTLILSTVAIILTVLSLGYFLWFRPNQVESERKETAQKKEKQEVKSSTADLVVAPGYIEPVSEEIEVGAEIAGKLKSVLVEEGEQVVKGQTIAVLENSDFEAAIRTARANIKTLQRQQETARARLVQAQAERVRIENGARNEERSEAKAGYEETLPNVENARREFERRQKLYETGDVSREEVERARTNLETLQKQSLTMQAKFKTVNAEARKDDLDKADATIRLAETQIREFDALIKEAEARVKTAEANLTKTIVRAPISGVVLRKRLKDGETISPEMPTGIVTIADISALRVRVDVDETDVAKIKTGQTAYVTADAYANRKFSAKVIKIGQILGRKNIRTERPTEKVDTKILEVLLELDKGQNLPLGLRVDAFITNNSKETE